ncbi:ATP-dependent Clp protease ATP-binding subunit ClpC [bioreactor metagenome]|uniref:ATP-dependent Clp protease ATP-binding subunit ClpC n=1 Tax=bioreactor metagenome TaxID=1076179 RepID=A0A645AR63_9ZZZZ
MLFDEVEKAHEEVWNLLLQLMEDGILTDAGGRRVDFRNTVVVMTSNVGASRITAKGGRLGFSPDGARQDGRRSDDEVRAAVMEELKKTFKPEFLNRVDDTIVFHPLAGSELQEIARQMLTGVSHRLQALGVCLSISDGAVAHLADRSLDPVYGARPLRRAIQTQVEEGAAELLLSGVLCPGTSALLEVDEGRLSIRPA